jgi:membrane associated rhomboid family serine protease
MFALVPIELKQAVPRPGLPTANLLLIAANVLVFLLGWSWPVGYGTGLGSILLYGFCHFNLWHLVFNMWGLWLFGNPVNRRLGDGYYVLAYLGATVSVGLICRLCCPDLAVGASGAIFAVMTIAMILFPSARLIVAYGALFPVTLLIGLIAPPGRIWLYWFIRGGTFGLRMYWCLVLLPLKLLADLLLVRLCFGVWGWGSIGHVLGVICGIAIVLMLPARITMPGRAAQGVL